MDFTEAIADLNTRLMQTANIVEPVDSLVRELTPIVRDSQKRIDNLDP